MEGKSINTIDMTDVDKKVGMNERDSDFLRQATLTFLPFFLENRPTAPEFGIEGASVFCAAYLLKEVQAEEAKSP